MLGVLPNDGDSARESKSSTGPLRRRLRDAGAPEEAEGGDAHAARLVALPTTGGSTKKGHARASSCGYKVSCLRMFIVINERQTDRDRFRDKRGEDTGLTAISRSVPVAFASTQRASSAE